MRNRGLSGSLVVVVVMGAMLATSGCKSLIEKLKKKADAGSIDVTASSPAELDTVNKADVTRFPDEQRLFDESGFVRVLTFARTAPDGGGIIVGVIDPDALVLKASHRTGNTLVTFTRAASPGKRFAGWVPDSAFLVPTETAAATSATTTTTATAVRTTSTATTAAATATAAAATAAAATASAAASAPVAGGSAPTTGTCTTPLRISGFTPSSPRCSFNENVRANSPSTMSFPCAGGPASVRFGAQNFAGSATKAHVTLVNVSTSTFQGCQVRTTQTITGTPPHLSYSLVESIAGGSCNGVSTCTARATITSQ